MRAQQRCYARRSCHTILWLLGTFLAVQLGGGLLLDYRYPLTRFPSAGLVVNQATHDHTADILFLGSSRTGTAILVDEANRLLRSDGKNWTVFNASLPAGDPIANEWLFEQLWAVGLRPRWVAIEIMPEMLQDPNPWLSAHVNRQLNWEQLISHTPAIVRGKAHWFYLEARMVPLYAHRKQLLRETHAWLAPPPHASFVPNQGPAPAPIPLDWDKLIQAPKELATEELLERSRRGADYYFHQWLKRYRIQGHGPAALERLLNRLHQANIKIILWGIPAPTAARAEYTPAIDEAFTSYIAELCQRYNGTFIDARTWADDALFMDHIHLRSETGGQYLTRRFTEQVLRKLSP